MDRMSVIVVFRRCAYAKPVAIRLRMPGCACTLFREYLSYLGGLRLDLAGTGKRSVNLSHVGWFCRCAECEVRVLSGGEVSLCGPCRFCRGEELNVRADKGDRN